MLKKNTNWFVNFEIINTTYKKRMSDFRFANLCGVSYSCGNLLFINENKSKD